MQRLRTTAAELIRHRRALPGAAERRQAADTILVKTDYANSNSHISRVIKDKTQVEGTACLAKGQFKWYMMGSTPTNQFSKYTRKHCVTPCSVRTAVSNYSTQASQRTAKEETRKDVSTVEEPFDPLTDIIPEKPVTFVEGASYSFVILAGLGVAAFAAYAVFKELVIQPKEKPNGQARKQRRWMVQVSSFGTQEHKGIGMRYKVFNKALQRIQDDSQVKVRIGSPITGYGSESRNRHARQRIPHSVWKDQKGVEHIKVNFYIRGPRGVGMVDAVMFKDPKKSWQFQYLVVDISSPSRTQLMLESYVPE